MRYAASSRASAVAFVRKASPRSFKEAGVRVVELEPTVLARTANDLHDVRIVRDANWQRRPQPAPGSGPRWRLRWERCCGLCRKCCQRRRCEVVRHSVYERPFVLGVFEIYAQYRGENKGHPFF